MHLEQLALIRLSDGVGSSVLHFESNHLIAFSKSQR